MSNASVLDQDKQYVMSTYARQPIALVRGKGARVWDADGKEYLDFVAGIAVNALGHAHPALVEAVCRQAETLIHVSNLYGIAPQAELAEWLCRHSFAEKAFFCNSGAEANEGAVKLARRYHYAGGRPERTEIVTAVRSFHGRTMAMLAATGQAKYREGFEPLPAGFINVPYNDLAAVEAVVGPQTAAVMVEPIQGESGVRPADATYLRGLRQLCDRTGALLIFDEIQTGVGRTGTLWAHEACGVTPDIMTLAKGLGGGVPIGAVLAGAKVAGALQPGTHGTTFGGNPLACAAALAVLRTVEGEGLAAHAAQLGDYFQARLRELQAKHKVIQEVRGRGLMIGCELSAPAKPVVDFCRDNGLLINGTENTVLRFLPPLIITRADVDAAIEILDRALAQAVAA